MRGIAIIAMHILKGSDFVLKYQSYDLKTIDVGSVIEVTLGYAANVRLMDAENFSKFKVGQEHKYLGGFVKQSPYKITVPRTAHWYVVVDLGGKVGRVSSAVRVLPSLPDAK